MKGIVIAGFAGIGKTYLGKKYKNVLDLDSAPYKYMVENIDERKKGKNKEISPEWPMNYVEKIIEEANNYDIVLINLNKEARKILEEIGFKYYLCFPNKNQKEKYLNRFITRGNPKEFVELQSYYFENELPLLYHESMEKMILDGDEYIEDYLLRNGYHLITNTEENL